MNHRHCSWVLLFSFLLALPSWAKKDIDFNSPDAVNQWIKIENGLQLQTISGGSVFEAGSSIAVDQLFGKTNQWNVTQIVDYNYGQSFPKGMQVVQISQRPNLKKKIHVTGNFFIEKKSDPESRLVLNIWYEGYSIYYNTDHGGLALAKELKTDIERELVQNSVFRGGILEFKRSGLVGFLDGVENFKYAWDSIIIDAPLKARIQQGVDVFLKNYNREEWKKYGLPMSQGVLLDGPPGTGKSLIAKIIISNILAGGYSKPVTYIHVQARHIGSVEAVRSIYQVARMLNVAVVYIEDIDLIAGTDRKSRAEVKNELMQQLSGIEALEGVLTIGTTNFGDQIDPALKRSKRLGLQYTLGTSAFPERAELFRSFLKGKAGADLNYDLYASRTEGLTGADIKQICGLAVDRVIKEGNAGEILAMDRHVLQALDLRSKTRLVH